MCDLWHQQVAKKLPTRKLSDPKAVELIGKLDGASCAMQGTVANGSDSVLLTVVSLVSVRTDGLTVIGTAYFTKSSNLDQLDKDFSSMVGSMLKGQSAG